ncbi:phage tail length tape measure family protein [Rhizobium leguminosarum]|uniref:phage tail length tape measure family protein n=1 Tax=Rhizobium leguminosarum TaxID=384 RepID=UPI00140FC874|nr:phage tail length tape measure family protein [Rhizobium leguminosarum]QIO60691.1 hypothetical protein HA463_24555 [Rhizobium leguminosarum bv. trifolii]
MTGNLPKFSMVMTSDDDDIKRSTREVREELSGLKSEAAQGAPSLDRHADALNKEAVAAERAAKANRELAAAEKAAREEANRATGARPQPTSPASVPSVPSVPPPRPAPSPVPPSNPPPPPPSNDNDRAGQFRRQNLTFQAFDVGQSLAGGMPLPMVLAQQGPQIAQIYAGQGGVNAALKDFGTIASGAARAITPLTAGVVGLAAVAATGLLAWNGYLTSIKEVETAASGLGRAVAGTSAEMEASAHAGAAAAGVSVAAARSMEAQFLRTGRIGSENFEQLIGISKDFGATIGVSAEVAGSALSDMFADPAKAAQTLFQQYGLIDAATARQATNLARQNRQSEAQALLLKALPAQLADAEKATTAFGRAWDFVSNKASNAFDKIGEVIDRAARPTTLEDQLADAQATRQRLQSSPLAIFDFLNPASALKLPGIGQEADLNEQVRRKNAQEFRDRQRAEEIARSRAAVTLAEGSGANADGLRAQGLRNDIAALQSGRSGLTGEDARMADAAIEAKSRVLDGLINRQQRSAELDRLDIQIQNERNPLLRAELEARRAKLELADQEISAEQLGEAAARARNRVIEETIAGASAQAQDMQAEFEVRSRLNSLVASGTITSADANRMLQEELTLRPLIAAAATAEGDAKERLNKVIQDLQSGYANLAHQEKAASAQEYLKGQNERVEQLRVEQALIGQNDTVRAQAMARLQAEQEIRRRGIDANSDLARQIRDQVDSMALLNRQIDKQAEAWSNVQRAGEDAIDGVVDSLSDGDLGGALDAVKDAIKGFALDDIKAGLENGLLGTDYGTSADIGGIGGIFTRLFGGGKADPASLVSKAMGQNVGTMSVNAATVMINGGVSNGISGLLGGAANNNVAGGYSGLAGVIPVTRSALPDVGASGDIASYIAQAAVKRGIDPNIALAVARSEGGLSSWNMQSGVFKNGIQEPSFGPFQLYKGGGLGNAFMAKTGLDPALAANGPAGVDFALDYASKKGWGAWYGAGKAGISDWQGIGGGNMGGAAEAVKKLTTSAGAASKSFDAVGTGLRGFDSSVTGATQNLGTFGNGIGQFGQNLANSFPPAPSGGGGNWLSNLFGGLFGSSFTPIGAQATFAASGGIGLYDRGGWTGAGAVDEPAGVVHRGEIVWSQKDIARNGGPETVEAMRLGKRGYLNGGRVDGGSGFDGSGSAGGQPTFQIFNQSSTPIKGQVEEERDETGRRNYRLTLSDEIGNAAEQKGGGFRRTMGRQYGLRVQGIAR